MRGVYIICEGHTEKEFVNSVLRPYFNNYQIYDVRPILMSTGKSQKGGDIKFDRLKLNIETLLKHNNDIIVSTLIDFYKLKSDFPKYELALKINNKIKRVDFLENSLAEVINNHRFNPYIQLHEFEALVFSSIGGFASIGTVNFKLLNKTFNSYPNPEDINENPLTSPSNRLKEIIQGYDKINHGIMIIRETGIKTIINKCPRFSKWVETLIKKVKE